MFQWANYSHFYWGYKAITGNWKYADSTMWTVRDRLLEVFEKEYIIKDEWIVDIKATPNELYKWVEVSEGKGYGFLHILGLAYKIILRLIGFAVKNPFKDGKGRLICNEWVLRTLNRYLPEKSPKDPEDMDLNDTYEYMLKLEELGIAERVK